MRYRDTFRPVELAEKIFGIFVSSVGHQPGVDRKYQRIGVKRIRGHHRAVLRHGIDLDLDRLATVLGWNINVVECVGRALLAPLAVQRIAIADILRKLIKDLDVFIVGPNLFVGCKLLQLLVLFQLRGEFRA